METVEMGLVGWRADATLGALTLAASAVAVVGPVSSIFGVEVPAGAPVMRVVAIDDSAADALERVLVVVLVLVKE